MDAIPFFTIKILEATQVSALLKCIVKCALLFVNVTFTGLQIA